jgi:hypothetical protein
MISIWLCVCISRWKADEGGDVRVYIRVTKKACPVSLFSVPIRCFMLPIKVLNARVDLQGIRNTKQYNRQDSALPAFLTRQKIHRSP